MSERVVIPASGTVEFIIWECEADDSLPSFEACGEQQWRRPVVGLLFKQPIDIVGRDEDGGLRYVLSADALKPFDGQAMDVDPLVVDECGSIYTATDYLAQLLGDSHFGHSTHIYSPHITGPIGDAPRIRFPSDDSRRIYRRVTTLRPS